MSPALQVAPAQARDTTIDFARIVAALFVIYVHSSLAWSRSPETVVWLSANLTNVIGHASVPLFLMMSGSLVIGRNIANYGSYLRKRVGSTLRPYAVGTVVYLVIEIIVGAGLPPTTHAIIQNIILGISYVHLYFLFILLGMYIITPIMQSITYAPPSSVIGTTVTLFLLAAATRIVAPFGFVLGYLSLGTCFAFLPYFLSGYVLRHVASPAKRWHFPLFAIPVVISMVGLRFLPPALAENFLEYDSPTVMVTSVGAFCLLMRVRLSASPLTSLVSRIADLTLGIYVLHLAVLLGMAGWLAPHVGQAWQVVLFPPLCFILTAGIVRTLHLVPGVKGWI